jgi:hypothetical protein
MPTGQECAVGFPGPMQFQTDHGTGRSTYFSNRSVAASILIPGMTFTCDATITRVTVGGVVQSGKNQSIKLCIWKKKDQMTYYKSEEIIVLTSNICDYDENEIQYSCQLKMGGKQISVERGDILGIELPSSDDTDFELHSVPAGLKNFIFEDTNFTTIDLRNKSKEIKVRPLIIIMLDSGTCTIILIMTRHDIVDLLIECHNTTNRVNVDVPTSSSWLGRYIIIVIIYPYITNYEY